MLTFCLPMGIMETSDCFRALSYHWAKLPYENLLRVIFPQIGGSGPFLYQTFLQFIYFPVCWASFAAFSMATCCKACCRVACDDGRPNERRTSLAESCMLL